MRQKVVITGIGVVSPAGIGYEPLWKALLEKRSFVARIRGFDVSTFPVQIAAQLPEFDPRPFFEKTNPRRVARFVHLGVAAAKLAVADASLAPPDLANERSGAFIGSVSGPTDAVYQQATILRERGLSRVYPGVAFMVSTHSAAATISIEMSLRGPMHTLASDCPAGVEAIMLAAREIADGRLDVALAGGADAPVTPYTVLTFTRSKMLATWAGDPPAASRPFDVRRCGFVLSEAAGILVLESYEHARRRGAWIHGAVVGWGSRTDPEGDRDGQASFARAMKAAISVAGVGHQQISFINAHAPSMVAADVEEARAIRQVFPGGKVPCVTSMKGNMGQPLAAAGPLQVAVSILAAHRGIIPPVLNCDDPDPACSLPLVRGGPANLEGRIALVNCRGLAGNSTSLVVEA